MIVGGMGSDITLLFIGGATSGRTNYIIRGKYGISCFDSFLSP